tara:strand:+ start:265 stop:450 length:186 start_codon:yes stop_codon:yes gene_type:complete
MQVSKHKLIDSTKKTHVYKEKTKASSNKVKQYCQKHYQWEIINTKYTKNGIEYLVTINKGE